MALVLPATVHDPTVGGFPPAAWGDAVNAAIDYIGTNRPHCRVYNSAAISIPTGTITALTFNSERIDVGAMHSTVSNTGRITMIDAGFYVFGCCVEFAASATGERIVDLRANGTSILVRADQTSSAAVSNPTLTLTSAAQFAATDYLEVTAYQNSGGNLNVDAASPYSPEFWAMWVCS